MTAKWTERVNAWLCQDRDLPVVDRPSKAR
jgi:hypothetical protein